MLDAPQHGPRPLPLFLHMLQHETADSPSRRRDVMAGLSAYQDARRDPRPPTPAIAAVAGRARLLDYGGGGPPLVVVPSLINPSHILDLTEEQSLMRWLAGQGVRPLLVDWGEPEAAERDRDVAGHVTDLLLPLIDALGEQPILAGYCMGGTMAMAAATLRPPAGLALIATPWRFAGFPARTRTDIIDLWQSAAPAAERMGVMPMEVLQAGFWRIDPARTIGKYADFGRLDPASPGARLFVAMEDWANAGAPLTLGAARDLMDGFIGADRTGRRCWRVDGRAIVPGRIACPILNVVSTTDRIVPHASAARRGKRLTLSQGHVGMIVGGRARTALWTPLARWLSALPVTR